MDKINNNNCDNNNIIKNCTIKNENLNGNIEIQKDDCRKEIDLVNLKEKIKTITTVDKKLIRLTEEIVIEINRCNIPNDEIIHLLFRQDVQLKRSDKLPVKIFTPRNSLITDLLEINHIRAVYHVFTVGFILLLAAKLINDLLIDESVEMGMSTFLKQTEKFHISFGIWIFLQIIVLTVYPSLKMYSYVRHRLKKGKYVWDSIWLSGFILFQIGIIIIALKLIFLLEIPFIFIFILHIEAVRFVMKNHSYIRVNVPKIIQLTDDENVNNKFPSFWKFLYFLFAPTLIYCDNYPRTKKIRWKFVFRYIFEFICVILFMLLLNEKFIINKFNDFGAAEINLSDLITNLLYVLSSAFLILVCIFYAVLHCWLNFTAELLRFADRLFYKDWWNACSFDVYYRTWNLVVHEWLFAYIYKDMFEIVLKRSKIAATLMTFLVSSIVHESILGFTFGFFYPVLLIFFLIIGFSVHFLKIRNHKIIGNIFLWASLWVGFGIIVFLYLCELAARRNCLTEENNIFLNYFIPVSWKFIFSIN